MKKDVYELPNYQEKFEVSSEPINKDIGFVIIRPDMRHIDQTLLTFLENNNLEIVKCFEKKVDYSQYKKIYEKDLFEKMENNPRMLFTIPSRTLVYLAGNSNIVLFRQKTLSDEHSSDYVVNNLKGLEGRPEENTIRGDIVYKECLKLQESGELLDPFGMYEKMIKSNKKDLFHYGYPDSSKILRYAGQGVHCPNKLEAIRDLAAVLSLNELTNLSQEIN